MKTLLTISFTLILFFVYAQPRVVTFGEEGTESSSSDEKNGIKLNLFEFFSGDFPIYYERAIHEKISVEVGVGMTFADIYGTLFFNSDFSPFDLIIQPRIGHSLSAAVRFYPFEVFDGFYIAPEYKFRKHKWDREVTEFTNSSIMTVTESRTYSMPRLTFGYAVLYANQISFDWTIGIGMNTPTEEYYNYLTNEMMEEKYNTRPKINIGLKLGYVF